MKHASVDKSKRWDSGCRNHGSCPYCRRSRTFNAQRREAATQVRTMDCRWPDCTCDAEGDCEVEER